MKEKNILERVRDVVVIVINVTCMFTCFKKLVPIELDFRAITVSNDLYWCVYIKEREREL